MPPNKRRHVITGLAAILLALVGMGPYANASDQIKRSELAAIISAIRAQNLKIGRIYRFRLDQNLSPKSLRPLTQKVRRGQGRGLVWAELSTKGDLSVVIETRDKGHHGEEGILYSDARVTTSDTVELGREWTVRNQLSPNWWTVTYDLG